MFATDQILKQGRYRILSLLADDDSGSLYEASDVLRNSTVLLKERAGHFGKVTTATQLAEMNAVFADEAKALMDLKHDSLVSVLDHFTEIDRQFLVLEPFPQDLGKVLVSEAERPDKSEITVWALQLLDVLSYLHSRTLPVVHGAITPHNVALNGNRAKLLVTSVGVSNERCSGDEKSVHYKPLEQIWQTLDPTSQRVLSRDYDERSAELLLEPLDARSDLYSLAASLYHILTGTLPNDALDRSIAILDGKPDPLRPPSQIDPSVSPGISAFILKALAIRREARFESAAAMLQAFRSATVKPTAEAVQPVTKNLSPMTAAEQQQKPSDKRVFVAVSNFDPHEDLLELDPVFPVASSAAALEPVTDSFPIIENRPSLPAYEIEPTAAFSSFVAPDDQSPVRSRFSWRFPAMAAALIVVAGGFTVVKLLSNAEAIPADDPTRTTIKMEQPAPATPTVISENPAPTAATDLPAPAEVATEVKTNPTERNPRQPSPAAPEKSRKPAIASTKTPAPKKALTVDDLLNDN